jgi:hypothetical protein
MPLAVMGIIVEFDGARPVVTSEAGLMARKRTEPKASAPAADERVAVVVLKGTPEYREWLSGVSRDTLIPIASIVRDAVAKWAVAKGYSAPPDM